MSLPRILQAFTPAGTFGFYAGLNVVAFFMILFFLPEVSFLPVSHLQSSCRNALLITCTQTKQRTLEELDYVFGVTTRRHASFQLREQIPWWTRKWILRRKSEPEPQLYTFEDTGVINAFRGGPDESNPEKAQTHAEEDVDDISLQA